MPRTAIASIAIFFLRVADGLAAWSYADKLFPVEGFSGNAIAALSETAIGVGGIKVKHGEGDFAHEYQIACRVFLADPARVFPESDVQRPVHQLDALVHPNRPADITDRFHSATGDEITTIVTDAPRPPASARFSWYRRQTA